MAEDVAAKISIAIQNEDAIRKCNDVEDALKRITAAREKDADAAAAAQSSTAAQEEAQNLKKVIAILGELTATRKSDQAVSQADAAQKENIDATTESIRKETEAVKERTAAYREARKTTAAEAMGMSEEEYEKRTQQTRANSAKAQADYNKRWEDKLHEDATKASEAEAKEAQKAAAERAAEIKREKAAAQAAMEAERKATAEAQREAQSFSEIKLKDLEDEIKENDILIAQQERLAAIAKEQQARKNLRAAERNLAKEKSRGEEADPRVIKLHRDEIKKYEAQLLKASRATLRAEKNLRKLNVETEKVPDKTQKGAKGLQAFLRSFNSIASKIPGASAFSVPTEGLGQEGIAGKIALWGGIAGIAIAGVRKWMQVQEQIFELDMEHFKTLQQSSQNAAERIRAEAHTHKDNLDELKKINSKEQLGENDKFRQATIVESLNRSLENMQIEIDQTTGKIKNLGEVTWERQKQDAEREAAQHARTEESYLSKEAYLENEKNPGFWTKLVVGSAIPGMSPWATIAGGIDSLFGTKIVKSAEESIKAAWDETIGASKARQVDQELLKTRDEHARVTQAKVKAMEKASKNAELKYYTDSYTRHQDAINSYKETETRRRYANNVGGDSGTFRINQIQEYSQQVEKLKKEAEALSKIEPIKDKNSPEQAKAYAGALEKYASKLKELDSAQMKLDQYEKVDKGIKNQLDDMREEIKLQQLINDGKTREAELARIASEQQKKQMREGWTPEQAAEWAKMRREQLTMQDAKAEEDFQKSRVQFAQKEAYKYRDTTTAAVMANSMAGMQMQNRVLLQNTPQQQLLQVTKKESNTVTQINKQVAQIVNLWSQSSQSATTTMQFEAVTV